MKEIIEILIERGGMSKEDAISLVEMTRDEIEEASLAGDLSECEEILMNNLGLEPDYVINFLG